MKRRELAVTAALVLFLMCTCTTCTAKKKKKSPTHKISTGLDSAIAAHFAEQHEEAARHACSALVIHRASPERGDVCHTAQVFFELFSIVLSNEGYDAAARAWAQCRVAGMAQNLQDGAEEIAEWLQSFAEKKDGQACGPMG